MKKKVQLTKTEKARLTEERPRGYPFESSPTAIRLTLREFVDHMTEIETDAFKRNRNNIEGFSDWIRREWQMYGETAGDPVLTNRGTFGTWRKEFSEWLALCRLLRLDEEGKTSKTAEE